MRTTICALFSASMLAAGQVAPSPPALAFEVASVKPNTSTVFSSVTYPPGRFTVVNYPLRGLIQLAYSLSEDRLIGAPAWADDARFDIVAKASDAVVRPTIQQRLLMLRTLLGERFQLRIRSEISEVPAYALVPARADRRLKPQLRQSTVDCVAVLAKEDNDPDAVVAGGRGPGVMLAGHEVSCRSGSMIGGGKFIISQAGVTMAGLARQLQSTIRRPVFDKTGFTGTFDFVLEMDQDQMPRYRGVSVLPRPADADSGPTVFTALIDQLGLKLESTRGPLEVFVIDHLERPTSD